ARALDASTAGRTPRREETHHPRAVGESASPPARDRRTARLGACQAGVSQREKAPARPLGAAGSLPHRSVGARRREAEHGQTDRRHPSREKAGDPGGAAAGPCRAGKDRQGPAAADRKSTRLNSSHVATSYAVFRLKKKPHPSAYYAT